MESSDHNHRDDLGWDCSSAQAVTVNTSSPIIWSNNHNQNHHHVIDDRFLVMSNSSSSNFAVPELKKCHPISSNSISNLSFFSQGQEAMSLRSSDHHHHHRQTVLAKSGASTTIWGQTLASDLSCPSVNNRPNYMINPFGGFMADYGNISGVNNAQSQAADALQGGIKAPVVLAAPPTCSLESLDCLLSATNSNTDTASIEDDEGISRIFSECRNLWNSIGATGSNAISSGESESNNKGVAKDIRPGNNNEVVNDREGHTNSHQCTNSKPISSTKRSYFNLLPSSPPAEEGGDRGFRLITGNNLPKPKKPRSTTVALENTKRPSSSNINFQQPSSNSAMSSSLEAHEPDPEAIAQMKEMIYRAAAFRPVNLGLETVEKPRRKNVRISTDPQTVAARQRRERISERIRVLQRLVPGGSKMDTASMLDEAASYLKFLRSQVKALESLGHKIDSMNCPPTNIAFSFNPSFPMQTVVSNSHSVPPVLPQLQNPNHVHHYQS